MEHRRSRSSCRGTQGTSHMLPLPFSRAIHYRFVASSHDKASSLAIFEWFKTFVWEYFQYHSVADSFFLQEEPEEGDSKGKDDEEDEEGEGGDEEGEEDEEEEEEEEEIVDPKEKLEEGSYTVHCLELALLEATIVGRAIYFPG
jgi:hypothetical protein